MHGLKWPINSTRIVQLAESVGLTEKKIDYWLWGQRKAARKEGWEGFDKSKAKESRLKQRRMESDSQLVSDVQTYMKMHKLSQVTVGQEARISQAVISPWLLLKYHGHNDKVRGPGYYACGREVGADPSRFPCVACLSIPNLISRWTPRCGHGSRHARWGLKSSRTRTTPRLSCGRRALPPSVRSRR